MTANNNETSDIEARVDEATEFETSEVVETVEDVVERDVIETPIGHPDDEERAGSLAGRLLSWLVLLLVGAGVALWGGPKIAPHLPEWAAPAAKFITPGTHSVEAQVGALRDEMNTEMEARLSEVGGVDAADIEAAVAGKLAPVTETVGGFAERLDAVEATLSGMGADAGADAVAKIEGRLSDLETRVDGATSEIASITQTLAAGVDMGTASEETLARLAANASLMEGFKGEIGNLTALTGQLSETTGQLTERIDAVEDRATRQVEEAEARAAAAEAEAAEAEALAADKLAMATEAADRLAIDKLWTERLAALRGVALSGNMFEAELTALDALEMTEIPDALVDASSTGVPSIAQLRADLVPLTHAAIKTDTRSEGAESGTVGRLGAFLRSQVSTRPLNQADGDGTAATMSRIDAAVARDDMGAVVNEADSLTEAARGVLGDWLAGAERRGAVASALEALSADAS